MGKWILSYKQFKVNEANESTDTDEHDIIVDNDLSSEFDKAEINDYEEIIKVFKNMKMPLYNIYMQYKDKEDLKNKLLNTKFTEKEGDGLRFLNPLLKSYAKICDLYRKIKDCEDYIKNLNEEKELKIETAKNNSNLSDGLAEQIENIESKVGEYVEKINLYKREIGELEKKLSEKLKEIEDKLKNINK